MKPVRIVLVVALCAAMLLMTGCPEPGDRPANPPAVAQPGAKAQPDESGPAPAENPPELNGDIKVTWTPTSGNARPDPIGLLNGTALVYENGDITAAKTVDFKPNAPDAKSAKGRYAYTLDLGHINDGGFSYRGTMSIVWTMTIDRGGSRNEVRSVYTGKASCFYSPMDGTLTVGRVQGTWKTTDTFTTPGGSSYPHKTNGTFVWEFEGKRATAAP
jgi:hypothetical protein